MKTVKLTNKRVQDFLRSADIGQRLYDSQTAGFHLRKLKCGGSFYLAYKTQLGKRRIMPLGQFSENTCDQARNQAKEYAGRVITGDDILATRQAQKQLATKTGLDFIQQTYRQIHKRTPSNQTLVLGFKVSIIEFVTLTIDKIVHTGTKCR